MYDLDIEPMTSTLELDLPMVKMYHHTKNEVSMSTASKVIAQTATHTHTHTHMLAHARTHNENITSTTCARGNYNNKVNSPVTEGPLVL